MESLTAFRAALKQGESNYELVDKSGNVVTDVAEAVTLRLPGAASSAGMNQEPLTFDLSAETAFLSEDMESKPVDLRTVVNCWQCKDLSVAEYISISDTKQIPNLKFLERTDLIEWLEGSNTSSEFIRPTSASAQDLSIMDVDPSNEIEVIKGRGTLSDHNTCLHGVRTVDFQSVIAISQSVFGTNPESAQYTGSKQSGASQGQYHGVPGSTASQNSLSKAAMSSSKSSLPLLKPVKGKDPIILLSPSPSSLLNMANVQSFLERGEFVNTLKSPSTPNLLRITRKSNVIGSKVRFVVVDSVENFKPEYWNRVVAVFVTGQPWQLRQYKWNDAKSLFHNVLGFGLEFKNDPVPETLKQWNVKIETLERNERFRDREVVERVWERIETYMVSRGWPTTVQ